MLRYLVKWTQTLYGEFIVDAESKEEAENIVLHSGDFDVDEIIDNKVEAMLYSEYKKRYVEDTIEYKGIEYPVRYAHIYGDDVDMSRRIGTEALQDAVYNGEKYTDCIGECIDESIYCYVEDHIMYDMEQSEFERYIKNNFS